MPNTDQGLFTVAELDMSKRILANIFGYMPFINLGQGSVNVSELMRIFNLGVLVFAGAYVSYSSATSVINYAQHGGPMEAQQHNAWLPARMVFGTSMLIPTTSGYSMIQVLVMWAVLQGVGLADTIWSKMVVQLDTYGITPDTGKNADKANKKIDNRSEILERLYTAPNKQDAINKVSAGEVAGIYHMHLAAQCAIVQGTQKQPVNKYLDGCKDEGDFCIGNEKNHSLCGSFKFTSNQCSNGNCIQINQALQNSFENFRLMLSTNKDYNVDIISNSFYLSQINLYSTIKDYLKNPLKPTEPNSWADYARRQGWVAAGLNYFRFVKKDTENNDPMFNTANENIIKYLPRVMGDGFTFQKEMVSSVFSRNSQTAYIKAQTIKFFNELVDNSSFFISKNKADSEQSLKAAMTRLAQQATDKFQGIKSVAKNGTIFSERSNSQTLLNFTMFNFLLKIISSSDADLVSVEPINLMVVRNQSLVLNAKIVQAVLGLKFVADDFWYAPAESYEKQLIYHDSGFNNNCDNGYENCLDNYGAGIIYSVDKYLKGERLDPLNAIQNLGFKIVGVTLSYWNNISQGMVKTMKKLAFRYGYIGFNLKLTAGLISGVLSSWPGVSMIIPKVLDMIDGITGLLFMIDQKSMMAFLPVMTTISVLYFISGAMLALYLPFVPFIVFAFCVIGWIIAVIEAMIAAPLIALGVTHPQGHDLLGKSEQAMMLLLGVFIRPAAIILGFVFAIYLLYMAYTLLNIGYVVAILGYFEETIVEGGIIFQSTIFLSLILLYTYVLSSVVHQVFGLAYKVPEQLMRWIGLAPEFSGTSQMLGEVRQGSQGSMQQGAEGAKQATAQVPGFSPPAMGEAVGDLGEGVGKGAKTAVKKGASAVKKGAKGFDNLTGNRVSGAAKKFGNWASNSKVGKFGGEAISKGGEFLGKAKAAFKGEGRQ